jgi:sigma-B regulation protein RsbU (phosphoserine phosphatase)
LFYARLDPVSGRLEYANAGHPPPLVARSSGRIVALTESTLPIGIFPDVAFEPRSAALEPGDTLVLYTDGIREAMREGGEEFGESRLRECLRNHAEDSAAQLQERIEARLAGFLGPAAPMDDRTLVIVQRRQEAGIAEQESDRIERYSALCLA